MKTTLLLTTCLFAAGGMMLKKDSAEKKVTTIREFSFLKATSAKKGLLPCLSRPCTS